MANDKKFVTKNGLQTQNINFVDSNSNNTITVSMLTDDVLSFSGNTGQLFSISDDMTGTIFSVNDISGIPSIEVLDTGEIILDGTVSGTVLAAQAEAEAGTATDKLMTPQRVAQAIDVQAEGMILLGTLTTTSGTTQTLSGLTLTGYKKLEIHVSGVSHDSTNNRNLLVGTARMTDQRTSADLFYGITRIILSDGTAVSTCDTSSTTGRSYYVQLSGYTNASTSIVFSLSGGGNFDAGTIRVYGVR